MENKEYIERGALLQKNMYGNTAPITHRTYAEQLISSAPAADVVEVVDEGAEREYVESLLKRYEAYLLVKIDNTGAHVGKFEDITLDTDGNWIIEADVESLSVTDCGDFAPVVHGAWIHNPKREYDYICSVCRGDAPEDRMGNNATLTPYCPHCGAKMDGGNRNADA